jgi:glycosyltransferase involved in cell wall biosynthesis
VRVAHILRKYNPAEWGGTETALQRLFEGFRPRGVASVVYAPACAASRGGPDPLAEAGCVVKPFRACVPVWGLPRAEKEQMIAVGGNLMSFDLPRKLWREPGLQIIHSHALGRLAGIALMIAKRRHLPFVVTVHGGVFAIPDSLRASFEDAAPRGLEWGRLFGLLLNTRRIFADADAILTCNDQEAELLRAKYPENRIHVQPHGVPLAQFSTDHRDAALAAFPQLRGKDILLMPGRIDPIKNQAWVIEHARTLMLKHPRAMLVLAGACTDKAYGAKLETTIKGSGFAERVLLTGGLPSGDPRLLGLFQQACVVLLPSRSETFGLVVLEAWAAGTPVIASRTPGASALIRQGENGWLFDLDAPQAFHEAAATSLLNPRLARQMAESGRQLVAKQYDSAVLAERLHGLYEDLRRSSKLQAPSSKKPSNLKLKAATRLISLAISSLAAIWSLEFLWNLELEAWSF